MIPLPAALPPSWPDFVAPPHGQPVPRAILEMRAAELALARRVRPIHLRLR